MTDVEIIIPTFNEAGGVRVLLRRLHAACPHPVRFIDDGDDGLPTVVADEAARLGMDATVTRRAENVGGLSGAVVHGIASSTADFVVVMDGDGQHPPEAISRVLKLLEWGQADVVAASRYAAGGSAGGLSGAFRLAGSKALTAVARSMVPGAHVLTDPLTGFFAVRRDAVDVSRVTPDGFKILLEIVGTHRLRVAEVPFTFEARTAGESKLTSGTVVAYLKQVRRLHAGQKPLAARY